MYVCILIYIFMYVYIHIYIHAHALAHTLTQAYTHSRIRFINIHLPYILHVCLCVLILYVHTSIFVRIVCTCALKCSVYSICIYTDAGISTLLIC